MFLTNTHPYTTHTHTHTIQHQHLPDISWNFAKIVVDGRGVPRRRFSPKFETAGLGEVIAKLVKEGEEGTEGKE